MQAAVRKSRSFLVTPTVSTPGPRSWRGHGTFRKTGSERSFRKRASSFRVVGQFDCGSIPGWKTDGRRRILRLMDDPTIIKLYPDKESGTWNWELLLKGKRIAHGKSPDTQESAYTEARQALAEERERRSKR